VVEVASEAGLDEAVPPEVMVELVFENSVPPSRKESWAS
jgi:hypothetical protein